MSSNAPSGEEFLDLRQLVAKLWARRTWLIVSTAVLTIASVVYALTSERVFRATTVLASAKAGGTQSALSSVLGQVGGLASLAGIDLGMKGPDTEEALAVLRSREFTVRFFEDEHVLRKIYYKDWDERTQQWKPGVKPPSIARAFEYFDRDVRQIIQNRKTGLISVQIEWRDRVEAAKWANELVQRLNEEMRKRAIEDSNLSIEYLHKELESTSVVATRESINRLIEVQIKQRMLANVNQEYAFRIIDKAVVPEADEPVKPRRRKIVAAGMLLGFVLGAMLILLVDYFRQERRT